MKKQTYMVMYDRWYGNAVPSPFVVIIDMTPAEAKLLKKFLDKAEDDLDMTDAVVKPISFWNEPLRKVAGRFDKELAENDEDSAPQEQNPLRDILSKLMVK